MIYQKLGVSSRTQLDRRLLLNRASVQFHLF